MIRWLKILLSTLALCAILGVGALVWVVTDTQRLKPFIETLVTNATARPLKINGELNVSIGRIVTVRAEDIDWLNPPWSSQPVMLHIDEIEVSIDLYSIKEGPITITNGEAKGAQLFFEWIDGQPMNWDMRDASAPPSNTHLQPIPLALLQAQLNDVQLTFVHPALPTRLVFDISEASESQSGDNSLGIVASAALNDTEFDLRGEIGPFPELVIAGAVNYSVTVTNANASLKSRGRFDDLASIESPDVELQYSTPDIRAVLKTFDLEPFTSGPVEVDARLITEAKTIDLDVTGIAGEFKVSALLKTTNLTELSDLTLRVSSEGPSAHELGRLAGVTGLPASPYAINIDADRTEEGLKVSRLSAKTQGLSLEGSGIARKLPELRNFDLELAVKAESFRTLGRFARIESLPDLPFSLIAKATADDNPLDTVSGNIELGNTSAVFKSGISHNADFAQSTLKATINSADAREIITFYGLEPDAALPTELTFSSTLKSNEIEIDSAQLNVLDNDVATSGSVSLSPELALNLNVIASGDNLNQTVNLYLPNTDSLTLPAKPWGIDAKFGYRDSELSINTKSARVGDDEVGFNGDVRLVSPIPVIDALVAAKGDNLAASLAFIGIEYIPAKPYAATARLKVAENSIAVSDIDATLNDDRLTGSLVSAWPERPEDIQFDVELAGNNLRETIRKIDTYIPPDSDYEAKARGEYSEQAIRFDNFDARFGDARIGINGSIHLDPEKGKQQLDVTLSGPRLSDLGEFEALAFRPLPFSLSATLAGTRNDLVIRDFDANVKDSDLHGSIRIELLERPMITTKLTSNRTNLDTVLARIEQTPISNEDTNPLPEDGTSTPIKRRDRGKKILSDKPINFSFLSTIDADFALVIKEFTLLGRRAQSLGIAGTLSNGFLDIPIVRGNTEYGDLKADIEIHAETMPTRVRVKAAATNAVFSTTGMSKEDVSKLPRHNLVTRFTSEGDSAKELGAMVSGYFWMRGSDGMLPASNLSLLVGDLLTQIIETLNPFAKKQEFAPVRCDAVYLEAKDGIIQTSPAMILQTDRLSIVAAGEVNLKTEKINIGFRTSPLKGIGVSASDLVNPFIKLGGSLANPTLVLDPTSTVINGGAAFMTMGASLLATSMWNRWIISKDACQRMAKAAEKIRRKINPEHMPKMPKSENLQQ